MTLYLIASKYHLVYVLIQDNLVTFSKQSCSVFWLKNKDDMDLPGSVKGKLGGPSQRRLATSVTSSVLQSVCPFLIIPDHIIAFNHLDELYLLLLEGPI
jgi:hypothetical protein